MSDKSSKGEVKKIFSSCHRCNSKKLKFVKEQLITDPITEETDTFEAMVCSDCTAMHFIENGQVAFQWDKTIGDFTQVTHCPSDYEVAIAKKEDEPKGRISGHTQQK